MGQKTFDFGEDPGAANAVKLSGNFLIAAAMESMAEALAMLEKSNIDRVAAIEMLSSTLFACPVYQGYGKAIAEMRHTPVGFRLPLGLKDIELVLKTGGEVRAPMPVAAILRDRFLASIAKGRDEMDWSGFALGRARRCRLAPTQVVARRCVRAAKTIRRRCCRGRDLLRSRAMLARSISTRSRFIRPKPIRSIICTWSFIPIALTTAAGHEAKEPNRSVSDS